MTAVEKEYRTEILAKMDTRDEELGAKITIPKETHTRIHRGELHVRFFGDAVEVKVAIGKDHMATLVMDIDAWNALKDGAKVETYSLAQYYLL